MKHARARLGEPGSRDGKGIFDGERFRENTVTSSKADKSKQRHPCEPDAAQNGSCQDRGMGRRARDEVARLDGSSCVYVRAVVTPPIP